MADLRNLLPQSSQPIGTHRDIRGAEQPTLVDRVWYQFFNTLNGLLTGATVLAPSVTPSGAATGTTQSTAAPLTSEWSVISTVPVNSGVILPSTIAPFDVRIWNAGVNPLRIYPPVGGRVDGLSINTPYVLPAARAQVFSQLSINQWRSLQLG